MCVLYLNNCNPVWSLLQKLSLTMVLQFFKGTKHKHGMKKLGHCHPIMYRLHVIRMTREITSAGEIVVERVSVVTAARVAFSRSLRCTFLAVNTAHCTRNSSQLTIRVPYAYSYTEISRSLGPFYGAIAVPSVTRCRCRCSCRRRCCRGHRCAGGVRQ